jgi:uncharacterized protein (TIGR02266 family)
MRFPVLSSESHQGKQLGIDPDHELIEVLDASGRCLGRIAWGEIIQLVLATNQDESRFAHARAYPRAPLAMQVCYATSDGTRFDGLTGGIGGGGFFIESSAPLAPGTVLALEFSLPHRPSQRLVAKAKVVWARPKPERFLLFPGMGVQFTEIDEQARRILIELVEALNRNRAPS